MQWKDLTFDAQVWVAHRALAITRDHPGDYILAQAIAERLGHYDASAARNLYLDIKQAGPAMNMDRLARLVDRYGVPKP